MLDTDIIIQRIKATVPEFQSVEGSADYATVKDLRSFRTPCAYVVLAEERGSSDLPRGTHQAKALFGVVTAARNYSSARGSAAKDDARPLVKAVRAALVGWRPEGREFFACSWVQGDVLEYDANTLLWLDVFETTYYINGA